MVKPTPGSIFPIFVTSPTLVNLGLSIGGMPSLGGPLDQISENGTEGVVKSVWRHSCFLASEFADAVPTHTEIKITTTGKIFITVQICAAYAATGKSLHRDETV
jgi:hypothetical protein